MTSGYFVGTDRHGVARSGHTDNAAELAERCFKQGWPWLRITNDNLEVGAIALSEDRPRRRIWYRGLLVLCRVIAPGEP